MFRKPTPAQQPKVPVKQPTKIPPPPADTPVDAAKRAHGRYPNPPLPQTVKTLPAPEGSYVVVSGQGRTALVHKRTDSMVTFIPLSPTGFVIAEMPRQEFDQTYRELNGYPPKKCAALYVGFSRDFGASRQAMELLSKYCEVTEEQIAHAEKRIAEPREFLTPEQRAARRATVSKKKSDLPAIGKILDE